jgi:hypothetical protein
VVDKTILVKYLAKQIFMIYKKIKWPQYFYLFFFSFTFYLIFLLTSSVCSPGPSTLFFFHISSDALCSRALGLDAPALGCLECDYSHVGAHLSNRKLKEIGIFSSIQLTPSPHVRADFQRIYLWFFLKKTLV